MNDAARHHITRWNLRLFNPSSVSLSLLGLYAW